MSSLLQDVRFAARVLLRQPDFSLIVVAMLAIAPVDPARALRAE